MRPMLISVSIALSQSVFLAAAADAQESTAFGTSDYGGGWATPSLDVTQSIVSESINRGILDGVIAGEDRVETRHQSAAETKKLSGQIASTSAGAQFDFALSAQHRARNYHAFIARSQADNPGAAAFYDRMFMSNRYMDRLDASLQLKGLRSNNVADAFAVYWLSAWLASRGQVSTATNAQTAATRNMAVRMLGNAPSLAAITDTAKQEVADELLIKAGLLEGLTALSASDPALLKTIAGVARQSALQWGLDLDAMELTQEGFVFRKQRPN